MIHYVKGDVTEASQSIIAHGVNCQGAFGSGVAGAIRKKYPAVREAYLLHEPKTLGTCQYVNHADKIWVNAFTQENYGYDGKEYASLVGVAYCFENIAKYMKSHELTELAMPKIGCGLGGLDWKDVEHLINELLNEIDVYVYEL